jgi:hypothetical protein
MMFPPRLSGIVHRGRVDLHEPDVLALVPPTEDIAHLDCVWELDAESSPLVTPTEAGDEEVRRFLLDFGRRVLASGTRGRRTRR